MYNETIRDFLVGIDDRIKKMRQFIDSNDMSNYAILVHALKSDSKYLGFTVLADLAFQHELKSKENDINYVNDNFDNLINELKRIINVVKVYLEK